MPRRRKNLPQSTSVDSAPEKKTTSDNLTNNKENSEPSIIKSPPKRAGGKIHAAGGRKKQNTNGTNYSKVILGVQGYAFQDDIIGVTHVRPDGEDAFNLNLRNMILRDALDDKGFSSFVTLRDKNSGKDDDHLVGADGYPKYMFMSINIHKFNNAKEASEAVLLQCERLRAVSNHNKSHQ